jgi:hypothetical protein
VVTGPVKVKKHLDQNGDPQVFADPSAVNSGIIGEGSPIRLPYPGEAGQRNNFRGDGYFGIDGALSKAWNITEGQSLRFSWEVFNVTNSVRFDTILTSLGSELSTGSLGVSNSLLTAARVQHF